MRTEKVWAADPQVLSELLSILAHRSAPLPVAVSLVHDVVICPP